MKVKGNIPTEVEVSPAEVINFTIEMLRHDFDLPEDVRLRDGYWVYDVEFHTSHSWVDTQTYRAVKPEDTKALVVIETLEKLKANY